MNVILRKIGTDSHHCKLKTNLLFTVVTPFNWVYGSMGLISKILPSLTI